MIERERLASPTLASPRACSTARFAELPVPQGERSTRPGVALLDGAFQSISAFTDVARDAGGALRADVYRRRQRGYGGGIKVTTFFLLFFVVWAEIRGDADTTAFKRRIALETQRRHD
jgi:hypothetical protein